MKKVIKSIFYKISVALFLFVLIAEKLQAQDIQLADTTFACYSDSVLLDAGPDFLSYLWNTNEQTQTIWAKQTGWYNVLCTREDMTVVQDSTFVVFFDAFIAQPDTILTCYKYPVLLFVENDTLMYSWSSNDPDLIIENATGFSIQIIPPNDTTTVYVHITDSLNVLTCVDSVQIWLYPRMYFDEVNQINTGCPGTCKGQLQVLVSGGLPPYTYFWPTTQPHQYDSIAFGLCEAEYIIEVTDQYYCIRDTLLPVKVFEMPIVKINRVPEGQIYLNNTVTFSMENFSVDSIQIIDWVWDFGDLTYSNLEFPEKVYTVVGEYDVKLKYTSSDECIDSVYLKINVANAESVTENSNAAYHIIPNPTKGSFTIRWLTGTFNLQVFNATGLKIKDTAIELPGQVDLSGYANGIYFIRIANGERSWLERVIRD